MRVCPESDISDTKRSPDVSLHILFEGLTSCALDEFAGPVDGGTVAPACAGLVEEGWRETGSNGAASAEGFGERAEVALEGWVGEFVG